MTVTDELDRAIAEQQAQFDALTMEREILIALLSEYKIAYKDISRQQRFAFIERYRHAWPVVALCRALEVSSAGYYAWQAKADDCDRRLQSLAPCESEATQRAEIFVHSQLGYWDLVRECFRRRLPLDKNALIAAIAEELLDSE